MEKRTKKLEKASEDLQRILEELEPYIRRPVVEEPPRRGQWIRDTGKLAGTETQMQEQTAHHGYT